MRVELQPPGLNRAIEGSHAVSEPLLGFAAIALAEALRGRKVQAVFASAGTAAAGLMAYKRFVGPMHGAHVSLESLSATVTKDSLTAGVDFTPSIDPADPCDVYIFVAPTNSRGDAVALAVQRAVDKVPSATFVLMNPDLEDTILSFVFGIKTSDTVRSFVESFDTCYYYKGAFSIQRPSNRPVERGCVLRHHKGPWKAHGTGGASNELARWPEQPSREQIAALDW